MFTPFFLDLKKAGIPVSLREYLSLLEGVQAGVADFSVEDFYYFARSALVKDERHLDRFDQVFAHFFDGLEKLDLGLDGDIPEEWLRKMAELHLTDAEKREIEALGGWDKLMETLKQRLEEQKARHQGGNKWIGTAGRSPFGAYGYNPEGVRIGQDGNRNFRAVKVWDKREFKNFDDQVEIGTRNIKVALRKLRQFARQGGPEELDLDGTIRGTAENAGLLDIKMRPERRNAVKVLLLLDVGGSMDGHVRAVEELFSAAKAEFKHLDFYYFHNCVYEGLWKDNRRRFVERIPTWEMIHTYGPDYRVVFVGDASMSPYEIFYPGGSVEHWNDEAGAVWMERLLRKFSRSLWINPIPEQRWMYSESIGALKEMMEGRMVPLTLDGLERGIRMLQRGH